MKDMIKKFGIIALVAVIWFSMSAYDNSGEGDGGGNLTPKDALDGTTWTATNEVFTFNSPNFTRTADGQTFNGTYTDSGNTVTIT